MRPSGRAGRCAPSRTRGSIPRGRDHGGGDHPVPFRTRQLSPPSPRVLRCSPWEGRESRPQGMLFAFRGRGHQARLFCFLLFLPSLLADFLLASVADFDCLGRLLSRSARFVLSSFVRALFTSASFYIMSISFTDTRNCDLERRTGVA